MSCFVFAGAAFVARRTVVIHAGSPADEKNIARPREGIGRPKREEKPTVRPKIVVGTA
jgi:hypothetical protein